MDETIEDGAATGPRRLGPVRRLLGWLAAGVLLYTGWEGSRNGLANLDQTDRAVEAVATAFEIAYGVLGLAAFVAVLGRFRLARLLLVLWAAALTLTGGLAVVAWGGESIALGIIAALVTLPVAALVAWLALRWSRAPVPAEEGPGGPSDR